MLGKLTDDRARQRLVDDNPGMAMRDLPLPPWMRPANQVMHLPQLVYTDEQDPEGCGNQVGARMHAAFEASERLPHGSFS